EEPRVECENEVRRIAADPREAFCVPFSVQGVVHVVALVELRQRRSDSFLERSDRFKRLAPRVWPNAERSAASIYFFGSVSTAGTVASRADLYACLIGADGYPASGRQLARLRAFEKRRCAPVQNRSGTECGADSDQCCWRFVVSEPGPEHWLQTPCACAAGAR